MSPAVLLECEREHTCFTGGGSTSTSSTLARLRLTTTTDSPSLMATERGDLPARNSSIWKIRGERREMRCEHHQDYYINQSTWHRGLKRSAIETKISDIHFAITLSKNLTSFNSQVASNTFHY